VHGGHGRRGGNDTSQAKKVLIACGGRHAFWAWRSTTAPSATNNAMNATPAELLVSGKT
jgi:hypothetical protein